VLLQGRLQLVLALVRVLDRRDIGSEGHGGLIKLLLQVRSWGRVLVLRGCSVGAACWPHRPLHPTTRTSG
jgi:hypothetical protein